MSTSELSTTELSASYIDIDSSNRLGYEAGRRIPKSYIPDPDELLDKKMTKLDLMFSKAIEDLKRHKASIQTVDTTTTTTSKIDTDSYFYEDTEVGDTDDYDDTTEVIYLSDYFEMTDETTFPNDTTEKTYPNDTTEMTYPNDMTETTYPNDTTETTYLNDTSQTNQPFFETTFSHLNQTFFETTFSNLNQTFPTNETTYLNETFFENSTEPFFETASFSNLINTNFSDNNIETQIDPEIYTTLKSEKITDMSTEYVVTTTFSYTNDTVDHLKR